jgi:hypothetical protein
MLDVPNDAVPVGTVAGVQLAGALKLPELGAASQVASCACADAAASSARPETVVNRCRLTRTWPPPNTRSISLKTGRLAP